MSDTITCAQLVARTQRWLTGMHGLPMNRLQSAIDVDDTGMLLSDTPNTLVANSFIGVGDEIVYVWEVNQGAKSAVISRGMLGSEAAPHAAGAVVESGSRFPRAAIKDALQEEIRSWPDTVFCVKSAPISLGIGRGSFDLGFTDDEVLDVLAVDRAPLASADRWSPLEFRVDRNMPSSHYATGIAVTLFSRTEFQSTLRVLYAAPFDVGDMADDRNVVTDWGLLRSMCDIPPLGAASKLLQQREILRADTEGLSESRLAAEVPPTYQTQTATALRLQASRRVGEEALRLRKRYHLR